MNRVRILILTALSFIICAAALAAERQPYGILLLAHGGASRWNANVTELAAAIDRDIPTEVAFGMAQRGAIQSAIDRLEERGVGRIVAVPLFVSSHSTVITSTEYLLGLRDVAPPALERFARMSHGHGAHAHQESVDPDGTKPVTASVPITMTEALNDHPVVADILATRAGSLSESPDDEVVIVVAHGPVADDENDRWLADMREIVKAMQTRRAFHRIEPMTVRDDAPEPIRSTAAAELRARVEQATAEEKRVIIAPLLIAYGGIERGIRKRLEGLQYEMPAEGLLPDARLAQWVRSMASASASSHP
jgi:sirohydrochlorin ferrochelatase